MSGAATEVPPELVRARDAYARRAWDDAYQLFSALDRISPLGSDDLSKYSWAAGLSGRDRELLVILERLYQLFLDADPRGAEAQDFARRIFCSLLSRQNVSKNVSPAS